MRLAALLLAGRALAAAERGSLLYGTTQSYDGYRGTSTESALFCTEGELGAYYLAFNCEAYFPVLLYDGESLPQVPVNTSDRVLGPTGQLIADSFADLLAGQLHQSLAEAFVFLEGDTYWSGSWSAASVTSQCNTGEFGSADFADSRWLAGGQGSCQFRRKLLCLCANGTAITTDTPTASPSLAPVSARPSRSPSISPSKKPSRSPSSSSPSRSPTHSPTRRPTGNPTHRPTTTSPTTASPTTASPTTTHQPTKFPVTTNTPTAFPTWTTSPTGNQFIMYVSSYAPGSTAGSSLQNAGCATRPSECQLGQYWALLCAQGAPTITVPSGTPTSPTGWAVNGGPYLVDKSKQIIAPTLNNFYNGGPNHPLSTYDLEVSGSGTVGPIVESLWGACIMSGTGSLEAITGSPAPVSTCNNWGGTYFVGEEGYLMNGLVAGQDFFANYYNQRAGCDFPFLYLCMCPGTF